MKRSLSIFEVNGLIIDIFKTLNDEYNIKVKCGEIEKLKSWVINIETEPYMRSRELETIINEIVGRNNVYDIKEMFVYGGVDYIGDIEVLTGKHGLAILEK